MKEIIIDKRKPIIACIFGFFSVVVWIQLYVTYVIRREFQFWYFFILVTLGVAFLLMMIQHFVYKEKIGIADTYIRTYKKMMMIPFQQTIEFTQIKKVKTQTLKNDTRNIQLELEGKKYLFSLIQEMDRNKAQKLVKYLNQQINNHK